MNNNLTLIWAFFIIASLGLLSSINNSSNLTGLATTSICEGKANYCANSDTLITYYERGSTCIQKPIKCGIVGCFKSVCGEKVDIGEFEGNKRALYIKGDIIAFERNKDSSITLDLYENYYETNDKNKKKTYTIAPLTTQTIGKYRISISKSTVRILLPNYHLLKVGETITTLGNKISLSEINSVGEATLTINGQEEAFNLKVAERVKDVSILAYSINTQKQTAIIRISPT
ncbi:MAG: hypothetical protein HYS32_01365 [Candidatus Woesearchaeota archaeon]|nr:MAG: hypothetical protein HYS32_01365 [Candidatus Woesearchaeota archaeon]